MIDEERIKEARENVKKYLEEGLLKKVEEADKNILNAFRKNSEESLKTADFLFKNNLSWLWVVVCSYYAMYYIANSLLYSLRYKVGYKVSHKVTADSLIVFVRDKLKKKFFEDFEEAKDEALELAGMKADEIIKSFDFERKKRRRFQYDMTEVVGRAKADTSLGRAKSFIFEIEKLLAEK